MPIGWLVALAVFNDWQPEVITSAVVKAVNSASLVGWCFFDVDRVVPQK